MKRVKDDRRFCGQSILIPETAAEKQLVRVFIRAALPPCPIHLPGPVVDWGESFVSVPSVTEWLAEGCCIGKLNILCCHDEHAAGLDGGSFPITLWIVEEPFGGTSPLSVHWEIESGGILSRGRGGQEIPLPHISLWRMEGARNRVLQQALTEEKADAPHTT